MKLAAERLERSVVPPLDGDLLPSTRAWWKTVWSSPMASVYLDVDIGGLERLAGLVDQAVPAQPLQVFMNTDEPECPSARRRKVGQSR